MKIVSANNMVTGVFAAFLLAACAGNPASTLPPLESEPLSRYELGPGDQLRVVIYGHENVPTEYTVDEEGDISFPLASRIEAAGRTTSELEEVIAERLEGVLLDARPSVQILQHRPFYVAGGVNGPGAFPYSKNMTVSSAVAMAQGFTEWAYDDYVKVSRLGPNGEMKAWRAGQDDIVYPDDIILVYETY